MCDVHRPTITHITPEVVPPALAIAERDGLTGRDLLVALAAGCETATRVGLGWDFPKARARGWHGPGIIGPFGAAAAAGRLLGFDADTMARAFGLAGSQAAGTFAAWGTPTVKFHQCRGALSGLMAALLAQQEFVATREFLTAQDGGLYNTYSDGGKPGAAVADLGKHWELENIALRLWPCASGIQGVVTAMFELVEKHGIGFGEVKKVNVHLSKTIYDMHGIFPRYKGKFEALLSIHYVVGVILDDKSLTLAQFEPARYDEPKLKNFAAEQVEVKLDPTLTGVQAVVEAETTDGTPALRALRAFQGLPREPADARRDRGQVPHLREGAARCRADRGGHRHRRAAGGAQVRAPADGYPARGGQESTRIRGGLDAQLASPACTPSFPLGKVSPEK